MIQRLIFLFAVFASIALGGELQKFENCRLIATDWSDGDSFSVRFPDGKEQTIRLYGADCIEMHVTGDKSNARRLVDQRRYFGIGDIMVTKSFGEAAKKETYAQLSKPFTVYTAFADARGDGRFTRVYGFIETADGKNLAEYLVSAGLARAFGVYRQLPNGTSGKEWKDQLVDLELIAARMGKGAWAKTDWGMLSKIRKEARDENAELEVARGGKIDEPKELIDINSAPRDSLMSIPSIGEKTADSIISGRPYQRVQDLLRVEGIGPVSLRKISPYLSVKNASR